MFLLRDGFRDIDGQPFYEDQLAVVQGWADGTRDSAEWHGDHFNGSRNFRRSGKVATNGGSANTIAALLRIAPTRKTTRCENQRPEHGIAVLHVTSLA